MKSETIVWTILFVLGGTYLVYRAGFSEPGMAKVYVKEVRAFPDDPKDSRTKFVHSPPKTMGQPGVSLSLPRTVGIWVAAMLTLFIFSFLYRDNFFYKLAEAVLVGVSAAYWMVLGFWTTIMPNLVGKLAPEWTKATVIPGMDESEPEWIYLVPVILGIMLLWRLAPIGGWISRWPLAFIIGTTAGLRMVAFLKADFLSQIRNTILPLIVTTEGDFDPWKSVRNITIVLSVLASLTYFLFSFEHKGIVGKVAKVGIWVLMITFGVGFGCTVMGRIVLLSARLEFLFDDWLWLIDPRNLRL